MHCVVERAIGTWKHRFPCLINRLQYEPEKAAKIIVACAILHNLAIEGGDIPNGDDQAQQAEDDQEMAADAINGLNYRNEFILRNFL